MRFGPQTGAGDGMREFNSVTHRGTGASPKGFKKGTRAEERQKKMDKKAAKQAKKKGW